MKKEICAGGVIFTIREGSPYFLLLKGKTTGWWVFPKGHVEEGETLLEAAQREIKEETGFCDLTHYEDFIEIISFVNLKGNQKEVHHYLFDTNSFESVISDEHVDFVWLKFEEAYEKIDHDNQKRILKKAYQRIKNG